MTFSRKHSLERALAIKTRRAKTMAISKCNTDYNEKHNDEIIDATKKNYVKLENRIKKEVDKHQQRQQQFQEKLHHVD